MRERECSSSESSRWNLFATAFAVTHIQMRKRVREQCLFKREHQLFSNGEFIEISRKSSRDRDVSGTGSGLNCIYILSFPEIPGISLQRPALCDLYVICVLKLIIILHRYLFKTFSFPFALSCFCFTVLNSNCAIFQSLKWFLKSTGIVDVDSAVCRSVCVTVSQLLPFLCSFSELLHFLFPCYTYYTTTTSSSSFSYPSHYFPFLFFIAVVCPHTTFFTLFSFQFLCCSLCFSSVLLLFSIVTYCFP